MALTAYPRSHDYQNLSPRSPRTYDIGQASRSLHALVAHVDPGYTALPCCARGALHRRSSTLHRAVKACIFAFATAKTAQPSLQISGRPLHHVEKAQTQHLSQSDHFQFSTLRNTTPQNLTLHLFTSSTFDTALQPRFHGRFGAHVHAELTSTPH